ncbi:urease accessory protein UreF [Salmonella enterica subsp. enterica]|nr:urease accessory protein UreF [Salmonella enterica subsp. enterica serovar Chailey]
MDAIKHLRLMQLASSNLPVGGYTWSQGLEWATEVGWVTDIISFEKWQTRQMLQSFFCVDLPLFSRLHYACEQQDLESANRWTNYLIACRETMELREEERSRGKAFLRLLTDWHPDCPPDWRNICSKSQLCGLAWLSVKWGLPLRNTALAIGYSWIESSVMAGVKLVPFGQQVAQQLIITLSQRYACGFERALYNPDRLLGSATPLMSIASSRHETQYSRIFRS